MFLLGGLKKRDTVEQISLYVHRYTFGVLDLNWGVETWRKTRWTNTVLATSHFPLCMERKVLDTSGVHCEAQTLSRVPRCHSTGSVKRGWHES